MQNDLLKFGVLLDDIFYCPCHPSEGCEDRKPEIGMFLQASKKYNIDKEQSYMVGDKEIDIRAGKKFGISTILVTNKDERGNEDYFANDISGAVNWIIDNERWNRNKIFSEKKTTYNERKKLSIEVTKNILIKNSTLQKWKDFFNKHKKKDDLADCFLQGRWYLNTTNLNKNEH